MSADTVFDALGDGSRRAILRVLADGEHPVGAIAEQLPISRPAVSRHLKVLDDAGLVTVRAAGTRRLYSLRADGPAVLEASLAEVWGEATARFELLAENTSPTADEGSTT